LGQSFCMASALTAANMVQSSQRYNNSTHSSVITLSLRTLKTNVIIMTIIMIIIKHDFYSARWLTDAEMCKC